MPQMANRVQETTTTGGTGTITLGGAVTGYLTFASSFATSSVLFYTIDNGVGEWEIGIGTLVTTGTLSRTTVIASSNGGALVNFGSGTKRVFCSAPTRSLVPDQDSKSGYVLTTDGTNPAWAQTLNSITIGNTTPAAGAFTTLSASSTVSGTGFSTYLASPPAIGGTTPAAGAFTTLSASSTVSGTGFSTYLASPPAIGGTAPAAVSSTNLSYTGTLTGGTGVLNIGSGQIYKDTSGNVGIGTSLPGRKFHVYGTGGTAAKIEGSGTNVYLQLACNGQSNSQSGYIGYDSSANLLLLTNDTERLRIDSSGNVGIGTSSPGAKLDVASEIRVTSGSNVSRLLTDGSNFYVGTRANIPMRFETNSTTQMIIDTSGNVGIGTTTFGTSAATVLAIATGTAPSSGPADTVQFYSSDRSAGNTIPSFYCEGSGVTNAGITSTTVTNKIAVRINGTVYYLLATTNAT